MAELTTQGKPGNILLWANEKGEFVRKNSQFRNFISAADGALYPPEANRYHLYISLACPWAHRTLIVRNLKGLDKIIGLSIVHYHMKELGWEFRGDEEGCIPDPINNHKYLRDLYFITEPNYNGRYTVPVLFDKKSNKIVNNESSEIIRMFNSEFNEFSSNPELNLYPSHLQSEIDEINEVIYNGINNGVYKAGFATSQEAYEENAQLVYKTLLAVEKILKDNEYVCGNVLTEADIRLFTSIIRFDPVYYGHFKCNLISVRELPGLSSWLKRIYSIPGIKDTVNMEHIKKHYYMSHLQINPTGIVPLYNGEFVG